MGTGRREVAVLIENGLCRFVHRISSFLPETYVVIAFILTYRGRDRGRDWDRVAVTSSFRPEWRNLLAEWDWWLGAPNGAVRAGTALALFALFAALPNGAVRAGTGIGIEDRGAGERAF